MLGLVLLLIVIALLSYEFVWPFLYMRRARRHNCGQPVWEMWHPLGIRSVIEQLSAVRSHNFLQMRQNDHVSKSKRTFLKQDPLAFAVVTTDPENIKAVFATQFSDFSTYGRSRALSVIFGHGIFMLDGSPWKHARALLRPQFARDQITRVDSHEFYSQCLIAAIKSQSRSEYVDMQEMFHAFAMDDSTEFLLGSSVGALPNSGGMIVVHTEEEEITSAMFIESYRTLQGAAQDMIISGGLAYYLRRKMLEMHQRRVRQYIEYFIDRARAEKHTPSDRFVLVDEIVKDETDDVKVRDHLISILLAGRDTTAGTLSYAMYFLSQNPNAWSRLRQEILENNPRTWTELKRSSYLIAVINETLRMAPSVAVNIRSSVRDTTLPRGGGPDESQPILVPKGMPVSMSFHALHRDPEWWGHDAEEWRPERWLNGSRPGSHPWAYVPFSGGPRICLGQQFALAEMSTCLAELARAFARIQPDPRLPRLPRSALNLTSAVGGGVPLKFFE